MGDPRSCRNFVGGRRATPPSRAEQATGIDRPIDMWPVLSDLLNVMTAELPPNRLKSQLGDQPAFNSTVPVPFRSFRTYAFERNSGARQPEELFCLVEATWSVTILARWADKLSGRLTL